MNRTERKAVGKTMKNNGILLALVAALALGAGVTGTLVWMENRAPKPVAAPIPAPANGAPPSGSLPSGAPATEAVPAPPSTVGLSAGEAALTLGNYYYDIRQWPQAVAQYRVALANGKDNPNVRTDLGNALRFADEPKKALEQYQIAQKQDPRHEQSLFNQGGLWAQSLQNPAKGVAAWRAYLKRFPKGQSAEQARQFIAQFSG